MKKYELEAIIKMLREELHHRQAHINILRGQNAMLEYMHGERNNEATLLLAEVKRLEAELAKLKEGTK